MKFGLSKDEYHFLEQNLIQPLKSKGLRVFVFGSRVSGKHHPFSDIDILIEGNFSSVLDQEIIEIKSLFEDSNFPYKIDLVKEKDLAQSYRENVLACRVAV